MFIYKTRFCNQLAELDEHYTGNTAAVDYV